MAIITLRKALKYQPVELGFGTSGLRGLATDMTDLECYINTCGFLKFLINTEDLALGTEVAFAGDLRESTPRITQAVAQAISDCGFRSLNLGKVPTPTAAYYSFTNNRPLAMVTGSHIPGDRNGIKFYKRRSEVLKQDEPLIKLEVAKVRNKIYSQPYDNSLFDSDGKLKQKPPLPGETDSISVFLDRYTSLFEPTPLKNRKVIVYQHSSLAAEMLVDLMNRLGAEAIPVDKADKFIPIDTENVTPENQKYFKELAARFPGNFAIISADGDADRPFVIDETGTFQRGDILGALTAQFLKVKAAAVPISASDVIDSYLDKLDIEVVHTKIGSPYVIEAMQTLAEDGHNPVAGWEVNGGFLTGSDIKINGHKLKPLATRDAFLPIVCALVMASQANRKLSELFAALPARFTQAGLLDEFPVDRSQAILRKFSGNSASIYQDLAKFFRPKDGFGKIIDINSLDGIRITFNNHEIAHIRPSGNAPQLRIYSVADSQNRADEIVAVALDEPDGILRQLERGVV